MFPGSTTFTYVIEEPFDRALKRLRAALAASGLKVTGELDLSMRIGRALLVSLPPCVVIFVTSRGMTICDSAADRYSAALTPIHVVASARGPRTEVHFLKAIPNREYVSQSKTFENVRTLQASLSRTLERIGRRRLDN